MTAKPTTRRPQRQQSKTAHTAHPSTSLFTARSRDRLAGNILLLASMAADQAMLVELISTSPSSAAAKLSEISEHLEAIAEMLGGAA